MPTICKTQRSTPFRKLEASGLLVRIWCSSFPKDGRFTRDWFLALGSPELSHLSSLCSFAYSIGQHAFVRHVDKLPKLESGTTGGEAASLCGPEERRAAKGRLGSEAPS
jgi:hypothetical protein